MVEENAGSVALLPIQPRYAEAIVRGDKRVEFRRRKFARPVEHVVIYASSPVRKILGFFRVSRIAEGCPAEMWNRYNRHGAIGREAYDTYYHGTDRAYAIEIGEVSVLREPLALAELQESLKAPQSYSYVSAEAWRRLSRTALVS